MLQVIFSHEETRILDQEADKDNECFYRCGRYYFCGCDSLGIIIILEDNYYKSTFSIVNTNLITFLISLKEKKHLNSPIHISDVAFVDQINKETIEFTEEK